MSVPPAIFFINGDISYPTPIPPPPPAAAPTPVPPVAFPGTDPKASTLTTLQTQLFIDDTMTKAEFDARVVADPNYPTIIHLRGLRILVIVPAYNNGYFHDGYHDGYHHFHGDNCGCSPSNYPYKHHPHINIPNVELADVVMFLHQGLADIEKNNFGPPGQNYEVQRLTIYQLLRAVHSHNVVTVPFFAGPQCNDCHYPFFCDRCHTFSGIKKCHKCGCDCACGCTTGLTDNQGIGVGIVYAPNCDNEFHNKPFIHRK